jgi:hypothetical protein
MSRLPLSRYGAGGGRGVPYPVPDKGVRADGVYGRLRCKQRSAYGRVDPRWRRHHRDPETGGWCEHWSTHVGPCGHVPQRSARGGSAERYDALEAGRTVVVTAWELSRLVRLVPHPAVEYPWEDPRWFCVTADDWVNETDEPEWNKDGGMYPATGVFARNSGDETGGSGEYSPVSV